MTLGVLISHWFVNYSGHLVARWWWRQLVASVSYSHDSTTGTALWHFSWSKLTPRNNPGPSVENGNETGARATIHPNQVMNLHPYTINFILQNGKDLRDPMKNQSAVHQFAPGQNKNKKADCPIMAWMGRPLSCPGRSWYKWCWTALLLPPDTG